MGSFWWFIVVLSLIIVSLFLLYSCLELWLHCYQPRGGPQIVYPTDETTNRRAIIKESAYVSVFYQRNELRTSESMESIKSDETEGDDSYKENMERLKKIASIKEEQRKSVWNSEKLGCDLVVGFCASRDKIAGYLIDLKNRVCEFYSYDASVLPWRVNDKVAPGNSDGDSGAETENLNQVRSRNLIFGLVLWEEKLKEGKKFKLYTDDESIRWPDSKYGIWVRGQLRHLEECEKLTKMNSAIVVDDDDLDKYVRFILPAVDLSYMGIKAFESYVSAAYGIERFEGTHEYIRDEKGEGGDKKAVYMATKHFDTYQQKAKKRLLNHLPCYTCGFSLARSSSLLSLMGSGDTQGDEVDSQRKKKLPTTGKAPPASTLNRKSHQRGFPTLNFKTWGHNSSGDERVYPSSHKRIRRDDLLDPESATAGGESEDDVSTSSKATSGGCKPSKSTYSTKGGIV